MAGTMTRQLKAGPHLLGPCNRAFVTCELLPAKPRQPHWSTSTRFVLSGLLEMDKPSGRSGLSKKCQEASGDWPPMPTETPPGNKVLGRDTIRPAGSCR